MKTESWPMLLALGAFLCASPSFGKNMFTWRMVILPSLDFRKSDKTQEAVDFMVRLQKAGYNGIFFDGVPMRIDLAGEKPATHANLQRVLSAAKQNGITIIPLGQHAESNPYMDPSLVEAFPNKETPFVTGSGLAVPAGDPSVSIKNGDFENGRSSWFLKNGNWAIDSTIKNSGTASLRIQDPTSIRARADQNVKVKPYRTYRLSMMVKTQNIKTYQSTNDQRGRDIGFQAQSRGTYHWYDRSFDNKLGINSNWKRVTKEFHSFGQNSVAVSVQATNVFRYTGTVWFDDVTITEVGLSDPVVRADMPVLVKTASGQLKDGVDYTLGTEKLHIPQGSSAKEGDTLLVDWYKRGEFDRPAFCYDNVWYGVRTEIALFDSLFHAPRARAMIYSEWRLAGWDPVCADKYNTPERGSGPYMSAVANITSSLYKEANGSRISLLFNDMYDPYHKNQSGYYAVRGGMAGSGYGLDEDIVIMNWCATNRRKSLKFFAGMDDTDHPGWGVKTTKQRQIISSYAGSGAFANWLAILDSAESEGLSDDAVIGMSYHQYKSFPDNYALVEDMADQCRAAGRWADGPIPFPDSTEGIPSPYVGLKNESRPAQFNGISLTSRAVDISSSRLLRFTIPSAHPVNLAIYNLHGQEMSTVINERLAQGVHERKVDVSKMAPGVYFARLTVAGTNVRCATKKMIVF